jgi:phage shock protein PspC (stress-responsive transcriptional regulator)
MNKVVNINLGGIPFTLDETAFEHLNRYLDAIDRHFRHTEGYEEIIYDIELRLAELIREGLGSRPIAALKDVEAAIRIMGTPQDFESEDAPSSAPRQEAFQTGRRLFRNPDDVVLAGVSSGIAAYFGIREPLWIRLLFVGLTLTGTFGIPIYLLLWAVIPKAKSAADKLAMRGEPINISSIAHLIQKELENLSREVSEFTDDISGKNKQNLSASHPIVQNLQAFLETGGTLLKKGVDLLSRIWRPLMILIGALLIFFLAVGWMATLVGLFSVPPYLDLLLVDKYGASRIFPINLLLLVGIPIAIAILGISRVFFRAHSSKGIRLGLLSLWAINLLCIVFLLVQTGKQFAQPEQISRYETLMVESDTLRIEAGDLIPQSEEFEIDQNIFFWDDRITYRGLKLNLYESPDEAWKMEVQSSARGKNRAQARVSAEIVMFNSEVRNNRLTLPNALTIGPGEKFRAQRVDAKLYIPQGKYVQLSKEARDLVRSGLPMGHDPRDHSEPLYLMTENGLKCTFCQDEAEAEKDAVMLSGLDPDLL